MVDDYRDEHPESSEPQEFHEDSDPAAAFEALRETIEDLSVDLRREMTTIRKGVEAAFDQFERQGAPIDYSTDLGAMSQQLATLAERVHGVERSPILRQGAEHYARALENSGRGLVQAAAQQFQNESRDFQRVARELAEHTKSALTRKDQVFWMWVAAGSGLVAGAFLMLLLPRFLPFSADSHVAGLIMGLDRVNAGRAMIEVADPAKAGDISTGGWVYETNRTTIDKCIADMFRSEKEQRCMLTLPVVQKGPSRGNL